MQRVCWLLACGAEFALGHTWSQTWITTINIATYSTNNLRETIASQSSPIGSLQFSQELGRLANASCCSVSQRLRSFQFYFSHHFGTIEVLRLGGHQIVCSQLTREGQAVPQNGRTTSPTSSRLVVLYTIAIGASL